MYSIEKRHAIRYAIENTKLFLMAEYRRLYPYYFQHATIQIRPATEKDYFIPPSIADKCIVVVKTQFDELGCKKFACYPFKENWHLCEERDPVQWVWIGHEYGLACQKSCQDHSQDTEWVNGRCIASNPFKKLVAGMTGKILERDTRSFFHYGLKRIDGHLKIDPSYCEAYGLDYQNEDCVTSGLQKFGEFIAGTTTVRSIKSAHIKPFVKPSVPIMMPYYTLVKTRKKRSLVQTLEPDDLVSVDKELMDEMANEVFKAVNQEIAEYAIEKYLRKKVPNLLSKAVDNIALKLAIQNSMIQSIKRVGTTALKILGSAATMYAVYATVNDVLDAFDFFDYQKVMDKKTLDVLDKGLDYLYFKEGPVRPELTPEYIWNHEILDFNAEEVIKFTAEKIEEYMNALNAIPPNEYHQIVEKEKNQKTETFVWVKQQNWTDSIFISIILVMIVWILLFLEWIHIWSLCLFFIMLWYQT